MPIIHIEGLVSFATNHGVSVHVEALQTTPEKLFDAVQKAYAHLNDQPLRDACCGGVGPLAEYADIDYDQIYRVTS